MKLDISQLRKGIVGSINFDDEITIPDELVSKTEIKKLSKIKVSGKIVDEQDYGYLLSMNIKGEMILLCALTLEDVPYDFDINVEQNIDLNGENTEKNSNTLDILPIIWENIVLEIPIRVVKKDAEKKVIKSGEGWNLSLGNEKSIDPRLEKLNELLKEDKK